MEKISIKQIIRTNAVYGGKVNLNNSLTYAVDRANNERNFYRKLAYLIRSMTSDHSFSDGNKRTAITIILSEFKVKNIKVNKIMLEKTIRDLSKTGEGNINIIERRLRRCSKK